MSRISRYARLRPRQFLGPREKGLNAERSALLELEGWSQREGSNVEGELGKFKLERLEAYPGQDTKVCEIVLVSYIIRE